MIYFQTEIIFLNVKFHNIIFPRRSTISLHHYAKYELKIVHLIRFIQTTRVKTMFVLFNILNQNFYYYTLFWRWIET